LEGLAKLRGLYEYSALEDNELSFGEGEMLTLVAKLDDDWWLARNQTDFGLVPANYVEIDTEQLDEGNVFAQSVDMVEEESLFEKGNSGKVGNLLKELYPKARQEKKWVAEWNDEQRIKGKLLLLDAKQLVFIHGKEKVTISGDPSLNLRWLVLHIIFQSATPMIGKLECWSWLERGGSRLFWERMMVKSYRRLYRRVVRSFLVPSF
jgi:hypothetical protein